MFYNNIERKHITHKTPRQKKLFLLEIALAITVLGQVKLPTF